MQPGSTILDHDQRETKGTRSFLQLRTTQAHKIRCGQKHFETLHGALDGVVTVDEV